VGGLEDRNHLETIEEPIDRQEMQTLDEVIDGSDIGVEGSAVVLEAQEGGCGVRDGRIETPELEEEDDREGSGNCEPIASTSSSGAKSVSNERPFVCFWPNCGKRLTLKTNLNRHNSAVHLKLKRFKCDAESCGQCFKRKEILNRHKSAVHLKEKRFQCGYKGCDKMFVMKDYLNQHKRVHSGEKPYACDARIATNDSHRNRI
jgi:uncharacterized Zn-finger protein